MRNFNLVDSCGWLEYVVGSAQGKKYFAPINDLENLIVPTICIYEVFKRIMSQQDEEEALRVVANMHLGKVVDLDSRLAVDAAQLSRTLRIPMADAIVVATAHLVSATIWTQDEHFKDMKSVKFLG
ncbi:MAG: type II toxin-antitoxin system VapC family toxin [Candidatus Riflebacteria bacterium]|nr:type II toxin-antitoxin system VapC family toxin [Candidatus Riflebacteria bacterium]